MNWLYTVLNFSRAIMGWQWSLSWAPQIRFCSKRARPLAAACLSPENESMTSHTMIGPNQRAVIASYSSRLSLYIIGPLPQSTEQQVVLYSVSASYTRPTVINHAARWDCNLTALLQLLDSWLAHVYVIITYCVAFNWSTITSKTENCAV